MTLPCPRQQYISPVMRLWVAFRWLRDELASS
jgi:hypothetical protein